MTSELDDSIQLIAAAQGGDEAALNHLITRYYDRVRSVVRARMGARLRKTMDSDDILQDTFLTAVRIFDRFEVHNDSSLIHWLAKLAERQILDAATRVSAQKRSAANESTLASNPDLHPEAEHTGPLGRAEKTEQHDLLLDAIGKLRADYREIILQRHYMGSSWQEIAAAVGRPSEAAARMMYGKARTILAKQLIQAGLEETGQLLDGMS